MKTYQQLWQSLTPLYEAGEAQAIVRTVLDVKYGMTLTDIICGKVNELSADEGIKLEEIIARLQKGEPVQYILGQADFAGKTFHVEPGVLIPRPETAELCQWIVETQNESVKKNKEYLSKEIGIKEGETVILDLCTGSGCIAITLSLEIPNAKVWGIDISEDATDIAAENAVRLGSRASICTENIFDLLQKAKENRVDELFGIVDIIVSNPPYICEKEKADMEKNVLDYEPDIALFVPDEDPLKFYRAIAEFASLQLRHKGLLYFEINPLYEKETREMLEGFGFKDIETKEDSFGKKRMMRATKK